MKLPPHDPSRFLSTDGFSDPVCTNGTRSEFARLALESYQCSREMNDDMALGARDLLTDLMHYLHSLGEDPMAHMTKAVDCFEMEAGDVIT